MSYMVLLFAFPPDISIDAVTSEQVQPLSLGPIKDVMKTIDSVLPEVKWTYDCYGQIVNSDFVIEFNLGHEEIVDSVGLRILGGGDVIPTIKKLCEYTGWRAYDAQCGDFMDFGQKSEESWQAWQGFRDRVINQERS